MTEQAAQRYTGTSVRRVEDLRILTGSGKYVDDVKLPDMLHAAFLRSPVAHARIAGIDASTAREAPGVLAVYTGEEIEAMISPGPYGIAVMAGLTRPEHSCLATDKVRLVGDLVALVVAETRYAAEDAMELIEVDYEELPAIVTTTQAQDPAYPPIFDELGSNILLEPTSNTYGDIDGAFGRADHVLRATLIQHRHQNVPMETRGCVASYDSETGRLVMWSSNQGVHYHRNVISDRLGMDPGDVRILAADVGGSFGLKINASREDVAVAAASRALGLPIKYIEDRYEHLAASGQAREESFDVEAAYTDDGDILGLKVKMVIDAGAYPGLGATLHRLVEPMFPSAYKIGALQFEASSYVTNKATYVAYRGPWASETFVRERIIDLIAHELGREPMDIRMRNVVSQPDHHTTMITGRSLVGVTLKESLERMEGLVDLPSFRRRQAEALSHGRYLGIGFASYIEAAPGPKSPEGTSLGPEAMRMELDENGKLVVITAQMPHGQGHETAFAQIAADEFGVPFDDVRLVFGDSDAVPPGLTGGSRSATMTGGVTLTTARRLKSKVLDLAADVMEASAQDLLIKDGRVAVAGVPSTAMGLAEVVSAIREPGRLPDGTDLSLSVENTYDGGEGGWAGGTHCAMLEVDVDTGLVRIERYVVTEDCGELINPAIVDGQIRGGVAQGIGAVLLEQSAYDEHGNFLSGTFMDYLMPTAMDIPRVEIVHVDTVPLDPDVNFRGVGEGGMIVAPATVCNAIEDALLPLGARVYQQHLPPAKVLELARVIDPE